LSYLSDRPYYERLAARSCAQTGSTHYDTCPCNVLRNARLLSELESARSKIAELDAQLTNEQRENARLFRRNLELAERVNGLKLNQCLEFISDLEERGLRCDLVPTLPNYRSPESVYLQRRNYLKRVDGHVRELASDLLAKRGGVEGREAA